MPYLPYSLAGASSAAVVVQLSQHGITSDASSGIDFGAAAPAGATGQEAAINALLASAVAAATAAGVAGAGVRVIWDVAVALGGPVYLYSNMTIEAANPACGIIIRPNAQCPVFRLKGMDADQTQATNSQKSFGKYDPAHPGDTRYRVFDPAFVNVRNLTILGGTWNANSLQQPQVDDGGGNATTPAYGFLDVFSFWGIDGLTIKDVRVFLSPAFVIHLLNCRHVLIDIIDLDQRLVASGYFCDGIHVNGPAQDITIRRARTHTFDDHIAFSPNDAQFGFLSPGVNWIAGGGDITGVLVDDWEIWNGRDNVLPHGAMRLLSTVHKVDQVTVRNARGQTGAWAFLLEPWLSSILNGTGVFGRIVFDNTTLDLVNTGHSSGSGFIQITGALDSLAVKGRYRANAQNFPDINVEGGAVIQTLRWEGDCYQPAGSANNVPVIKVGGTINLLSIAGRSTRDASVATAAAPFVLVASVGSTGNSPSGTGAVATIEADVSGERITNLIDIEAGSVATVVLRGSHRKAGGGSPINVASGATVANLLSAGLVYDHNNVSLTSGAGAITRLDYNESTVVTYATGYTTALNKTTGLTGSAVSITFTPTGGNWPTGTLLTPSAAGVAGTFSPSTISPTGLGAVTVLFTPSAAGAASLSSSAAPTLPNTTGSLGYTVTVPPVATAYTTALNQTSGVNLSAVIMTFTPTGGSWPASTVLTPSVAGLAGTFSPTTISPTGTGAVTSSFTPSATGTASLSSSATPTLTNTTGTLGYVVSAAPAVAPGAGVLATPVAGDGIVTHTYTAGSVGGASISGLTIYSGATEAACQANITAHTGAALSLGAGGTFVRTVANASTEWVAVTATSSIGEGAASNFAWGRPQASGAVAAPLGPDMTASSPAFAAPGRFLPQGLAGGGGNFAVAPGSGSVSVGFWLQGPPLGDTGGAYPLDLEFYADAGLSQDRNGIVIHPDGGLAVNNTGDYGPRLGNPLFDGSEHYVSFTTTNGNAVVTFIDGIVFSKSAGNSVLGSTLYFTCAVAPGLGITMSDLAILDGVGPGNPTLAVGAVAYTPPTAQLPNPTTGALALYRFNGTTQSGDPAAVPTQGTAAALPATRPGGPTLLDTIATQPLTAYGLRRLRSAYAGNAILARRSSDQATQGIGFDSNGVLDSAALLSFVGSGDATIARWYDQTGNGCDLTSPNTSASEPKIVAAGLVTTANGVPTATMAGGTNVYGTAGVPVAANLATFIAVAQHAGTADTTLFCFVQAGQNSYATQAAAQGVNATASTVYAYRNNAQTSVSSAAGQNLFQVSTVYDGANQGVTLNNAMTASAGSSGAWGTGTMYVGGAYSGSAPLNRWSGSASELLFYGAALSSADLATLHANQAAYFATP